jgi:hypothetical protein
MLDQLRVSSVGAVAKGISVAVSSTTPLSNPVTLTGKLSCQTAVRSKLFKVKGLAALKIASPPSRLSATLGGTVPAAAQFGPKKPVKPAVLSRYSANYHT